jgi:membrane-associated protein
MPVIRTFAPILAGVGQKRYPTFILYNLAGGALWSLGLTGLGFFLGSAIPNIDRYIIPIIIGIIFISIIPTAIHILKDKNHRDQIIKLFKKNKTA